MHHRCAASRVGLLLALLFIFSTAVAATTAELYFSSDKNGQNRVTRVGEGDSVWIVVVDKDENIDCDVRDKIWTNVTLVDPKTGAMLVWASFAEDGHDAGDYFFADPTYRPYLGHSPGTPGSLAYDYLEETGKDTGIFVSHRSFHIGSRASFDATEPQLQFHVDDGTWSRFISDTEDLPDEFWFGTWSYYGLFGVVGGFRLPLLFGWVWETDDEWMFPGRFENQDTLVGLYVDPDDPSDVALALLKIEDATSTLFWDRPIYRDARSAATVTVVDPDENLDSCITEYVPVFILVNPGSWDGISDFWMLRQSGGVDPATGDPLILPFEWWTIYSHPFDLDYPANSQRRIPGAYYVEYPTEDDGEPVSFRTTDPGGFCRVVFYAAETAPDSGIFELDLSDLLIDLGFDDLRVGDTLVAYYLDPNDFDDFSIATARIEEAPGGSVRFVDSSGATPSRYWLGRDRVAVEVTAPSADRSACRPDRVAVTLFNVHDQDDLEVLPLDETSDHSGVFTAGAEIELRAVWNSTGLGDQWLLGATDAFGGYQLQLDNWRLEAFNEDTIAVRYNAMIYDPGPEGLEGLGDAELDGFPPAIESVLDANSVSFDVIKVADTQVFDGDHVNMCFLDRVGNRVLSYGSSDCVFIEIVDPDQDQDAARRERIDAFWDGGQNWPIGPVTANEFGCAYVRDVLHPFNALLGDTNVLNNSPLTWGTDPIDDEDIGYPGLAKIYVLNPRSGRWIPVDLIETAPNSGRFVSTTCVDLTDPDPCEPTLGVLPGDTIIAVYQDPSNHSDSAWISIKVGIGGGGTPPTQASTTTFVDSAGVEVSNYTDADLVYVKIVDPSHAAALLEGALTVEGKAFDLMAVEGEPDVYMTEGLDLDLVVGDEITATYTDPTDPTDTSSDTITIIASELDVTGFIASPNPFEGETEFTYKGSGIASVMSVTVYNLAGKIAWAEELANVSGIVWDGTDMNGAALANGGYIYVIMATDGTNTFTGKGIVFVQR